MAHRATVYFGPPLAALTADIKDADSVSGRINRAAERYSEIIARHALPLNDTERTILGNCLSGSWADPLLIRHLADEVQDSEYASSPAADALAHRLRAASFAELVATVESLGF